ncbi:MAG: MFS transporter [Chloroflexi bacterium]|nr:MFS transporter [Chloroflexota bacterium]MYC00651.1 MFS transporter [Chloroflexota bacterium]
MLAESQQLRRRLARNIPVYYLFYGVSGFLIWMPIWVIYLQDFRGMSLTQVGTIESIFWITVVVAEVPTGAVADRWGRRVSLAFAGGIFCLGSVVFAFSSSYVILLAAYVIVALSMTLYSGAGPALVYDTLRQLGRTREYEKHIGRSEALAFGSMLIATLLAGPLVALVGYSATILLGAIAMGIGGLVALLLHEPPRSEAEIAGRQHGQNGVAAAPNRPGLFRNMLGGMVVVWRSELLLWYILLATLLSGVIMIVSDFLLQPFVVYHGVNPASGVDSGFAYSGMLMSPVAGMVVGSLIAAWVASRFGERRSLILPLFAAALIFLVPTLWESLWVVGAIGLLAAIRGMTRPIATGYINRRIPSDQRATVLSMFELSAALIIAIILPQAGAVADAVNFQASFGLLLVILVGAGGLFAVIWRMLHGREQTRAAVRMNSSAKPQAMTADSGNLTPSDR